MAYKQKGWSPYTKGFERTEWSKKTQEEKDAWRKEQTADAPKKGDLNRAISSAFTSKTNFGLTDNQRKREAESTAKWYDKTAERKERKGDKAKAKGKDRKAERKYRKAERLEGIARKKRSEASAFTKPDESFLGKLKYKWSRFKEEVGETLKTGKSAGTRMDENVAAGIRRQNLINKKNTTKSAMKKSENYDGGVMKQTYGTVSPMKKKK
jgi:hypothetical protein